jgi:hypothetical protein
MPDSTEGRVTLAILGSEIQHLTEEVRGWRAETKELIADSRAEYRALVKDHEDRIRTLESSNRRGVAADVGAYLAAIGAGIAGFFGGNS